MFWNISFINISNIVVFVIFYLALVHNYPHLQIFYMIWVITRVINAIRHYRCALRFLLVLWCALVTKSLGTTDVDNLADHASRGLHVSDIHSTSWLRGPKFLWEHELHLTPSTPAELLIGDPEVKIIQVLATEANNYDDILKHLSQFSSWTTLVKVVARI